MPLTPENLARHELAGLPVRVADADSPELVGIAGRVVRETMRTLLVDCDAALPPAVDFASDRSGVKQVPKQGTTFEFALPSETTSGEGPTRSPPSDTEERGAATVPPGTEERDGAPVPSRTDEAAAGRKTPGSTSELGPETAGVRPGQSGPFASETDATSQRDECEGVVYVTVDGARLLSRPATRTERAGDSTWH